MSTKPANCVVQYNVRIFYPIPDLVTRDEAGMPNKILMTRYTNSFVETQSEFLVYNILSLVAAAGGTMGLFLGWSVYENHTIILVAFDFICRFFDNKHGEKHSSSKSLRIDSCQSSGKK